MYPGHSCVFYKLFGYTSVLALFRCEGVIMCKVKSILKFSDILLSNGARWNTCTN